MPNQQIDFIMVRPQLRPEKSQTDKVQMLGTWRAVLHQPTQKGRWH
jgi:hypothetical protein